MKDYDKLLIDKDNNAKFNLADIFLPEVLVILAIAVILAITAIVMNEIYSSCDGTVVRTMFWFDCIEGR